MRYATLLLSLLALPLMGQHEITSLSTFETDIIDFRATSRGVALRGLFIFPARTQSEGIELWVSDGTVAGTQLLADLFPGEGSSIPQSLFVADSIAFFEAFTPSLGTELYRTDGTPSGTMLVKDIFEGADSGLASSTGNRFYQWQDKVYFAAQNARNNVELWATNGTDEGTTQVADIAVDPAPGFDLSSNPANFAGNRHFLFFTADDGISGPEVWRFDGNDSLQISDLTMPLFGSAPSNLTILRDNLYFGAGPGASESDLYRVSALPGADTTPELVFNFEGAGLSSAQSPAGSFATLDSLIIFPAGTDLDIDVWASNGTMEGTYVLRDVPSEGGIDRITPYGFTSTPEGIYYVDQSVESGLELWLTDGTEAGTFQVKDLTSGSTGSFERPAYLHNHLGRLYFTANGNADGSVNLTGQELYTSGGTNCTTFLVEDLLTGEASGGPYHYTSVEDQLFFFRSDAAGRAVLSVLTGQPIAPDFPELKFAIDSLTTLNCYGDSDGYARFTVSGGAAPYTFQDSTNLSGVFDIDNLNGGSYSFPVSDCRDSIVMVTFELLQPDSLELFAISITGQNSIEGGTIELGAAGGRPPYALTWSDTSLTTTSREDLNFGTYIATLVDANNCVVTDTFLIEDLTSTVNLTPSDFLVYPTVSNEQINVKMKNGYAIHQVEIHDLTGRMVSSRTTLSGTMYTLPQNLLPRRNGIYLLSVWTQQGKRGVVRIIIAR